MITITTETGSVYELGTNLCTKNGSDSFKYGLVRATPDWRPFYDSAQAKGERFNAHEWSDVHGESRVPVVGECLYVAGFREWNLSTRVVKVEES